MVWVLVREGVRECEHDPFFFHSGETIIWDFGEFGWKNESGQGRLGGGRNLGDRSGTDHPHFYITPFSRRNRSESRAMCYLS